MLIANTNVWETRIQNIDALLTARGGGRTEVYYLATVCQVGVDPPLLSISPNPEYPICDTIQAGGHFGINFLAKHQGDLIEQCARLERGESDKLQRLGFAHEVTEHGTPLLTDCIQSIECVVERVWDSGDHRTFIGRVIDRRIRATMKTEAPRRFRGGQTDGEKSLKRMVCRSGIYDMAMAVKSRLRPAPSIAEGTARFIGEPVHATASAEAATAEGGQVSVAGSTSAGESAPASSIDARASREVIRMHSDGDTTSGSGGPQPDEEAESSAAKKPSAPIDTDAPMVADAPIATRVPNAAHASNVADVPRSRLAPATPGICLVGCGWWGGVHALELRNLGKRVRRFFASRDLERARDFQRRFDGEDALAGLDAAITDPRVDAVLLALPHHLHADAARTALAAGKHVLIEKPLATDLDDAEELVRAAEASGLCLAVAEQYRLSPLVRRLRRHLDEHLIGRIGLVHASVVGNFRPGATWKNAQNEMGGGVLLDVGVHYVDVLRSLFGEPELVWAASPPHMHEQLEGEDTITALMRFAGGPVADLSISWCGFRSADLPNIELIGEKGSLAVWFRRPYVLHTSGLPGSHWSRKLRRLLPWQLEERARRWLPAERQQRLRVPDGDLIGSRALIEDFVLAITTGSVPAVSGLEGLKDLQVIDATYRAIREGRPVAPFPAATANGDGSPVLSRRHSQ
jgi:predicted dehydrogenase/flavin reductase (DIM6/NTAB) family NADH-FMN oxidoreductase RutF